MKNGYEHSWIPGNFGTILDKFGTISDNLALFYADRRTYHKKTKEVKYLCNYESTYIEKDIFLNSWNSCSRKYNLN